MKAILLVLVFIGAAFAASVSPIKIYPSRTVSAKPISAPSNDAPALGITNGVEAKPHSIPYQAYIIGHSGNQSWSCGGSLITATYVLTAAHCIIGASYVQVYLGVHDLRNFETGMVEINSKTLIVHEKYNDEFIDNDIGLIEIDGEVMPSQTINYARLPSRSDRYDLDGLSGRVSGWGLTNGVKETMTYVLLQTNDTVIPNLQCNAIFSIVRENELCLSGKTGNGPCRGDSGGPLVIGHIQEGIVSYGNTFCVPEYPTVFVRIRSFVDWLETHSDWRSR